MSRVTGGIYSKPSGKTAGIVWGAARTRQGKVSTARQLVPPSNPNTPLQQNQRTKFKDCLFIVRTLGTQIYRDAWNRSIGQLPGFQSLQSIMLNTMDDFFALNPPPSINLGTLHFPQTFSGAGSGLTAITFTWSTELVEPSSASDLFQVLIIATDQTERNVPGQIISSTTALRSAGTLVITLPAGGIGFTYIAYFKGAGSASGLYSVTNSDYVNSGA